MPTTEADARGDDDGGNQVFQNLWQGLDAPARDLWLRASYFAPEPASPALADACGLDTAARESLRGHDIIQIDGEGRFQMTEGARAFARGHTDATAQAAARAGFLDGVIERARAIDLAAGAAIYAADRAQLEEALSLTSSDAADGPRWLFLLDRVGTGLHAQRELEPARNVMQTALVFSLKAPGAENDLGLAARRANLAQVLIDMGELGPARDVLEQALASDAVKSLGDADPVSISLRSQLAWVAKSLGELPRARELLEQVLAASLAAAAEAHPAVAPTRYNLAAIHEKLGNFAEALALLEPTLRSEERNLGANHPSTQLTRKRIAAIRARPGMMKR